MAFRVSRRKGVNVMRVGIKVITTVVALYASGFMLNIMGNIMVNTSSPFYTGLRLIGWTVGRPPLVGPSNTEYYTCIQGAIGTTNTTSPSTTCITSTAGAGLLAIIGLIAVVWIIMEFIDVRT